MRDKDVSRVESWSHNVGSKNVREPAVSQAAGCKRQGAASTRESAGDHGTGLSSRKKPSLCGKDGGTLRTAESEAHEIASRALIGVDPDPYLNGATSPVHCVPCSLLTSAWRESIPPPSCPSSLDSKTASGTISAGSPSATSLRETEQRCASRATSSPSTIFTYARRLRRHTPPRRCRHLEPRRSDRAARGRDRRVRLTTRMPGLVRKTDSAI